MENILYYTKEAACFEEALPIGNGRLGAVVYGRTDEERISLNEDTLWSGRMEDNPVPEAAQEAYKKSCELIMSGKTEEAERLIETQFNSSYSQLYTSPGSLYIKFRHKNVTDYSRTLDLESGITKTTYTFDGVKYEREIFVSKVNECIAIKLTSSKKGMLSFELSPEYLQPMREVEIKKDRIIADGYCPSYASLTSGEWCRYDINDAKNISFCECIQVISNGEVDTNFGFISIKNADEALIYINIRTNYDNLVGKTTLGYKERALNEIENCTDYDLVKEKHIEDFSRLYNKVKFELGSPRSTLPTNERLLNFDGKDFGMYELLFNYGRYLLIASSREGTQPANLQGIWNERLYAAWFSNFTLDINLQMNYWHALTCNLSECFEPFVSYAKRLCDDGEKTARNYYGVTGSVAHAASDIWAHSNPTGKNRRGSCVYAPWNMSLGWIACQLFEAYEYIDDISFLEETAYPIMRKAAEFFLNVMCKDKDGYYIVPLQTSPENYYLTDGKNYGLCETVTMSMSIVRELFYYMLKCKEILNVEDNVIDRISEVYDRLYPMEIGKDGRILEWYREYDEFEPLHRHMSHLYGLYPGKQLLRDGDEKFLRAAEKSLDAKGGDGTGWSIAWKLNMRAILGDGKKALELLKRQLKFVDAGNEIRYDGCGGTYANMLDAHPPFQIDGNFGATAGIANMLLQSSDECIKILPALPNEWTNGSVKGLVAVGNTEVSIKWENSRAVLVELTATKNMNVTVKANGNYYKIQLEKDKKAMVEL